MNTLTPTTIMRASTPIEKTIPTLQALQANRPNKLDHKEMFDETSGNQNLLYSG